MVRVPSHCEPTHPGETLLEVFLVPMGASQRELADAIHVPYQWINELVNVRRGVTSSTALRFARFPYNTIYWGAGHRGGSLHAQCLLTSDLVAGAVDAAADGGGVRGSPTGSSVLRGAPFSIWGRTGRRSEELANVAYSHSVETSEL